MVIFSNTVYINKPYSYGSCADFIVYIHEDSKYLRQTLMGIENTETNILLNRKPGWQSMNMLQSEHTYNFNKNKDI